MKTVAELTAPGTVFKRVLNALRSNREELHLDGSPDYQRGVMEGLRMAESIIKSEEGNLACEVTAICNRDMPKS